MDLSTRKRAVQFARGMLEKAGVTLRQSELDSIEVTDFGFGCFERIGLTLLVYVNTDRYCAKELVLLPGQTCPEHLHPPLGGGPGKEETFRCRLGEVLLYLPGPRPRCIRAAIPASRKEYFTVFSERVLSPGDQVTIAPETPHWFQAGKHGAVISEFSSTSRDETDLFTDPQVRRTGG